MKKRVLPKLQKVGILMLILALAFSTTAGYVFAETTTVDNTKTTYPIEKSDKAVFQRLLLKVLSWDEKRRDSFIDEVVKNLIDNPNDQYFIDKIKAQQIRDESVVDGLYKDVMSDEDLKKAVDKMRELVRTHNKDVLIQAIKDFRLPQGAYDVTGFESIAKRVNLLTTGNADDYRGAKLLLVALTKLSHNNTFVGGIGHVVFDGDKGMVFAVDPKHNLVPLVKGYMNEVLNITGVFENYGVDDFDGMINKTNKILDEYTSKEREAFKQFLIAESKKIDKDSEIYGGKLINSPTPTITKAPTSAPNGNPGTTTNTTPTPSPVVTASPSVSPTDAMKETDKIITSFKFEGVTPAANGYISEQFNTIRLYVSTATDVKALVPTIEFKGASISPKSGEAQDFTKTVFYTVTAKDGTSTRYKVMVFKTDRVTEGRDVVPGAGFTDIKDHWSYDSMIRLLERGILDGYPDGTVKPNNKITRAEAAVLIIKAAGLEPAAEVKLKFKDAQKIPAWAKPYIQAAVDTGFIKGYEDNTFRASADISRSEAITMLMVALGLGDSTKNTDFKDSKDIPVWAMKYVAKAKELGVVAGYPGNLFKPLNSITRAELITMIDKSLEKNQK